jgi:hypothetical protein
MTKAQIAAAIQAIVRLQLDDCKRAIKGGTKTIALNELEDAIRQLKMLAKRLAVWMRDLLGSSNHLERFGEGFWVGRLCDGLGQLGLRPQTLVQDHVR